MDEIDKKIMLIELRIDEWGISSDEQRWLVNRLKDIKEENERLNGLFNLQQTRMTKAIAMWRKAMGKEDTIPDLEGLLDWLMRVEKEIKIECGKKANAEMLRIGGWTTEARTMICDAIERD